MTEAIQWSVTGSLTGLVARGGMRFFVVLQNFIDGEWQVAGFASPLAGQGVDQVQHVFDHHAHTLLGSFGGLEEAKAAGEKFLRDHPLPTELCSCEDLAGGAP